MACMVFFRYKTKDGSDGFAFAQMAANREAAVEIACPASRFLNNGYNGTCPAPPAEACTQLKSKEDVLASWENTGHSYYEVFHAEDETGIWEIYVQEYNL